MKKQTLKEALDSGCYKKDIFVSHDNVKWKMLKRKDLRPGLVDWGVCSRKYIYIIYRTEEEFGKWLELRNSEFIDSGGGL